MSVKLPLLRTAPDREAIINDDPLGEFLVWWLDFSKKHLEKYRKVLSSATREAHLQEFFTENPMLLARTLGGGHGRWVIPHQRLGSEYVTDFIIGERSSVGFEWYAVELESPKAKMFTKAGDPTQQLTHALRQITDWRAWLSRNQAYAARLRTEQGLGLTDINPNLPGLVLIGRRSDIEGSTNDRRRQMMSESRIRIHSYDWLLDSYREMSVLPASVVEE